MKLYEIFLNFYDWTENNSKEYKLILMSILVIHLSLYIN